MKLKKTVLFFSQPLAFMAFCSLFLVACKTTSPQSQSEVSPSKPTYTVEPQNLASEGQAIMLARDLIDQDAVESAIGILKEYKLNDLALNEKQLYVLARAELAIARSDLEEALFWISGQYAHLFDRASKVKQMKLRFLRSDVASLQQDYLSAARERIFIDGELYGQEKQANHDIIWTYLLQMQSSQIESFLANSNSLGGAYGALDIVGWLQLALQYKKVKGQIYLQQAQLQNWMQRYSNHPAARMLPTPVAILNQVLENQPKQIAVLVPMSGKFSIVGRSIQAGVLSEYFHVSNQGHQVPKIMFYDTGVSSLNVIDLYNQAVNDGAQFVIGPFFEKPVNELANYDELTVPVLFLRSTNQAPVVKDKTLQFDLSLNHEVRRLAQQAYVDGHRNVALIYTKNSKRRQEFAQIFEQTFTDLGGVVVANTQLDTKDKFINSVKELMGIDASEMRARAIYSLLDIPVSNFEVRPRQDLDAIFMAVSQDESVRLKPIFNQQYASEIPFYALSEIYSGGQLPKQYDFDNMRLQTMPWQLQGVTHSDFPQRDEISKAYQANEASSSLTALGVDAYNIMMQFDLFKQFESHTISGVTGQLHQASDAVVHSKRQWIIINNNRISDYQIAQ